MSFTNEKLIIKRRQDVKRTGTGQYLQAVKKHEFVPTKPIEATEENQIVLQTPRCKNLYRVPRLQLTEFSAGAGEIPVVNVGGDVAYLMEILIGTPPQKVDVTCDTGSSDFWVVSRDILTESGAKKYEIFEPKQSTTFKKVPDATWKITYGDGSTANGDVGTDIVRVAGIAVKQTIEFPKAASLGFVTPGIDGLVGLGFRSNNGVRPDRANTLIESMVQQKAISEPLFSTKYVRGGNGEFAFGFIDKNDMKGDISWTPVDNKRGYWIINSSKARVAGQIIDRASDNQCMIDTGTTICLLDDELVDAIYAATPGARYDAKQAGYVVPTGTVGPTVELQIGDRFFQVPGNQIGRKFDDSGVSYGAFQSRGDLPFDIIGVTFLRNILAVFDIGNLRFGCALRPDVEYDDVIMEEGVSRLSLKSADTHVEK